MKWPSWIQIDLDSIAHNLAQIKQHTKAEICPILKGDGYGHGAPVLSAFLQTQGVNIIGVSDLEEALAILDVHPITILLLTPPLDSQLETILQYKIISTVTSEKTIVSLGELSTKRRQYAAVHLKVDTGLNRLGASLSEALHLADLIKKYPYMRLKGVFTHFAAAFKDQSLTERQFQKFKELQTAFYKQGWSDLVWHAANSAALVTAPATHLDLVRIGTLLFGQSPVPLDSSWDLENTWSFHTRLIQVRQVQAGTGVGYGHSYHTKEQTTIGVIPVGYGDGLDLDPISTPARQLRHAIGRILRRHQAAVYVNGTPAPIIGRIGMGLTSIDLSLVPNPTVGQEVIVPMRRVTCSRRIPKVYIQTDRIVCIWWENKAYAKGRRIPSLRGIFQSALH
ncbi:MAG: alanine racemase [Firmicutes bacterium]|jgi:alanine racemase|nr:alanine racemase [Bacillota bacterium]